MVMRLKIIFNPMDGILPLDEEIYFFENVQEKISLII